MAYVSLIDDILEGMKRLNLESSFANSVAPALNDISEELFEALKAGEFAVQKFKQETIASTDNEALVKFLNLPSFSKILKVASDNIRLDDEVLRALKDGIDLDFADLSNKYPKASDTFKAEIEKLYVRHNDEFKNAAEKYAQDNGVSVEEADILIRTEWGTQLSENAIYTNSKAADDLELVIDDVAEASADTPSPTAGAKATDDVGKPSNPPKESSAFGSSAKWAWNHTAGIWVNPVVDFVYDTARVIKSSPNYLRRGLSYQYSDHQYTKDLFARMDTYKTTNAARLSMAINPDRAVLGTGKNFVYKNRDETVENLSGALNGVGDALERSSNSIQANINNLSTQLKTASDEIAAAVDNIKQTSLKLAEKNEFDQMSLFFGKQSNDISVDEIQAQLGLYLEKSNNNEISHRLLQGAYNETKTLRNLSDADRKVKIDDIYKNLSDGFQQNSLETQKSAELAKEQANSIVRKHQQILRTTSGNENNLDTIEASAKKLDSNISKVGKLLEDIEAPPPVNEGDLLIGGSAPARLAAWEARKNMPELSNFSRDVSSTVSNIKSNLDITNINNILNSTVENEINNADDLLLLSQKLADQSSSLNSLSDSANITHLLGDFDEAQTALQTMDNAVVKYTRTTRNENLGVFAPANSDNVIDTQFATELNVGRIEREVSSADKKLLKALIKSGDIKIETPQGISLNQVLNYEPGETVQNIIVNGNSGHIARGELQRNMEYAMVNRDMQAAVKAAEKLLDNPKGYDENRYWEVLKWAALSYGRNTKEVVIKKGVNGEKDITTLVRDPKSINRNEDFFKDFAHKIIDQARGRYVPEKSGGAETLTATTAREQSPFNDRIEKGTDDFVGSLWALGANSYRTSWAEAWDRNMYRRFDADRSNEQKWGSKTSEGWAAHQWQYGFRPTQRLGMNPVLRLTTVIPEAIWDNIPYKKSNFSSWKGAGITIVKQGTIWAGVPYALVKGYEYAFSDDIDEKPEEKPKESKEGAVVKKSGSSAAPVIGATLEEMKEQSTTAITTAQNKIEAITKSFGALSTQVGKLEKLRDKGVNDYIKAFPNNEDKYIDIRTQLNASITSLRLQMGADLEKATTKAKTEDILKDIVKINNIIKDADTPSLVEMKRIEQIEAIAKLPDVSVLNQRREEEIKGIYTQYETALTDATPLTSAAPVRDIMQTIEDEKKKVAAELAKAKELQAEAKKKADAQKIIDDKAAKDAQAAKEAQTKLDAQAVEAEKARLAAETKNRTDYPKLAAQKDAALVTMVSISAAVKSVSSSVDGIEKTLKVMDSQIEQVKKVKEELLAKDGEENKDARVRKLDNVIDKITARRAEVALKVAPLTSIKATADALEENARALSKEIKNIEYGAEFAASDAIDKNAELKKLIAVAKIESDKAAEITSEAEKLFKANRTDMRLNSDYTLFKDGKTIQQYMYDFDNGGIGSQLISSENGAPSKVGALAGVFKSTVSGALDFWGDMKRGTTSDEERFFLNLAQFGAGVFGTMIAINTLNIIPGINIPGGWSKLIIGAAALYFLSQTGRVDAEMVKSAAGSSLADKYYEDMDGVTNSNKKTKPPVEQGAGKNLPKGTGSVDVKNQETGETKTVDFTVNLKEASVISHKGGVPKTAADIAVKKELLAVTQGNCNNIAAMPEMEDQVGPHTLTLENIKSRKDGTVLHTGPVTIEYMCGASANDAVTIDQKAS